MYNFENVTTYSDKREVQTYAINVSLSLQNPNSHTKYVRGSQETQEPTLVLSSSTVVTWSKTNILTHLVQHNETTDKMSLVTNSQGTGVDSPDQHTQSLFFFF